MDNMVFDFAKGMGYIGLTGAAFLVGFISGGVTALLICDSVVKEKKFWDADKPNTFSK